MDLAIQRIRIRLRPIGDTLIEARMAAKDVVKSYERASKKNLVRVKVDECRTFHSGGRSE